MSISSYMKGDDRPGKADCRSTMAYVSSDTCPVSDHVRSNVDGSSHVHSMVDDCASGSQNLVNIRSLLSHDSNVNAAHECHSHVNVHDHMNSHSQVNMHREMECYGERDSRHLSVTGSSSHFHMNKDARSARLHSRTNTQSMHRDESTLSDTVHGFHTADGLHSHRNNAAHAPRIGSLVDNIDHLLGISGHTKSSRDTANHSHTFAQARPNGGVVVNAAGIGNSQNAGMHGNFGVNNTYSQDTMSQYWHQTSGAGTRTCTAAEAPRHGADMDASAAAVCSAALHDRILMWPWRDREPGAPRGSAEGDAVVPDLVAWMQHQSMV
jgi:hypothetical protein